MTKLLEKRLSRNVFIVLLFWLVVLTNQVFAKNINLQETPLRIAVAANFAPTLKHLLNSYPNKNKIKYQIISAATGTLYQQINHGAPFDLYLAADSNRPKKLEQAQLIVPNSRKSYAFGQLALWSASTNFSDLAQLNEFSGYLAIANPETAPYGKAAKQVLEYLALWSKQKQRLVTGININQTFQQVRSQAVPAGIVALSQLKINNLNGLVIPSTHYQPIAQQLVILKASKQVTNAQEISRYLLSAQSQQILHELGYLPVPDSNYPTITNGNGA